MGRRIEYPKLRNVEAVPTEVNGRQVICLRDPTHHSEAVLFVPVAALNIIRHFDGKHSILDIQAEFVRRYGELLFREQVEEIINTLDEHYFLESDRFTTHQRLLEGEFRQSRIRPAFLAGRSYPSEPGELHQTLNQILEHSHGPASIPGAPSAPMCALIAPHIDFMRGGVGYAWAYRDFTERTDAELFIIFGTAHAGTTRPFSACGKDFDTPLGPVRTDRDFLEELKRRSPTVLSLDDIAHRTEHSIEFQVVFLRHLAGAKRPIRILPILCGSFHEWLLTGKLPSDDPEVLSFLESLAELLHAQEKPPCLIAGVDLAHMGARFGDHGPITADLLRWIEGEDRQMLEPVVAGDADSFFRFVGREGDRRRICGLSPIYTLLHLMKGRTGQLLHYGQASDAQGVVSFCSVSFPA